MTITNRYSGKCHACGKKVPPYDGVVERIGRRRWKVWCMSCYNDSDCSGPEDRCCGNRAYEDQCARIVGYE